ncbi:MAG: LPS export ABC transporter permease LptG [Desulfobacterales bacterium]|nr:LPS export ABC transporter permease LptG [Desulfobacterales bacterium]MDJ0853994.1 LPS export ABC transporter permease LptG [Desulfobacterales bacterium]MDJ0886920.1 LPS export ABC transporter permease LptG [Desulfobacterales bacterium]
MRFRRINKIDFHIGRNTLQGVFLVLAGLLFLFGFLELLSQLNDVGKGQFRLADAFVYVALTLPRQAVILMPISALLGCTVSLGMMADHNELTAMQAAGISVRRIGLSVATASILLMLISVFVAEFIAPPLDQHARLRRSQARYGKTVLVSKSGFWMRQERFFIHVAGSFSEKQAADIELYELDPEGQISRFLHARTATLQDDRTWLLEDVSQQRIEGGVIQTQALENYRLNHFLTPSQMQIFKLPPDSLSISDLWAYIRSLKARNLNAENYDLALWQKITQPVTTASMVLLALTFIFGPVRMRSAGKRIATGMIVGILFYLLNQVFGHMGLLFNIPPLLTTLMPVGLILLYALRQLGRTF